MGWFVFAVVTLSAIAIAICFWRESQRLAELTPEERERDLVDQQTW